MDAFGGGRSKTRPPEKGVFPLDHDGECKIKMTEFLTCIKSNKGDHFPCKNLSKAYLRCRMDSGLMKDEDLNTLGYGETATYERKDATEGHKEKGGFIAGLGVVPSKVGKIWS